MVKNAQTGGFFKFCQKFLVGLFILNLQNQRERTAFALFAGNANGAAQNIDYALDEREKDFDPQVAVRSTVYAYTGKIETVVLKVDPKKLNDVIDKFGSNITIAEEEDGRLRITLKASLSGMKYWALQYLAHVEVLEPMDLREEIAEMLMKNNYLTLHISNAHISNEVKKETWAEDLPRE